MSIVTLQQAKNHLRVDNNDEDDLIMLYIDAAGGYISKLLNTTNVPGEAPVQAASLLIVGGLYENRESENVIEVKENPAVMRLLHPFRECLGI